MAKQTNYTIAEGVELPSKGKIYHVDVDPRIELRSMTARDEMKRLSPSNTPLKTLADIIEDCCLEKPAIHVYDMCLGDYEFLLHKLRVVTYGDDYQVVAKCLECGNIAESTAHLGSLDIIEYEEETVEAIKTFVLPKSGSKISLRFTTPRMAEEMEAKAKDMKRRYKEATIDFDTLVRVTSSIDFVDGDKKSERDLEQFVLNLAAIDLQKILNNIDKLSKLVGVDTTLYLTCPHCGNEIRTFFRFGPEFFRPSNV